MRSDQPSLDEELRHLSFVATARIAVIAVLVAMIPFNSKFLVSVGDGVPQISNRLDSGAWVGPIDVLLVLLVLATLPLVSSALNARPIGIGLVGVLAITGVVTAHILFGPTTAALILLLRIVGAAAVIIAVQPMTPRMLVVSVVWPLSLVATFQALLALGQTLVFETGRTFSVGIVGSDWTAGFGTANGPFEMAAFLVFAISVILATSRFRRLNGFWWVAVGLSSAAVSTALGRSGILAVVLIGSVYIGHGVWRRSRVSILSGLASTIPAVVVGLTTWSAWWVRAVQTGNLNSGGRGGLMRRAVETIESNPLFGVGPMQYGAYLARLTPPIPDRNIVHNMPLLMTAELGLIFGISAIAWSVALAIRSFRTSVYAVGIFVSITPYLMLDKLHYMTPAGLLTVGVWIALLDFHWRHATANDPSPTVVAPAID
jgi:hypothetical protein